MQKASSAPYSPAPAKATDPLSAIQQKGQSVVPFWECTLGVDLVTFQSLLITGCSVCLQETSITYREWLPNAKQVFLIGEFNKWENTVPLKSEARAEQQGQVVVLHTCAVCTSRMKADCIHPRRT